MRTKLADEATTAHAENRARVVRARQRYEQVQALKAEGKNVTTVMRELRLAPGTARRYYRAASVDEVWLEPIDCPVSPPGS